MGTSIAKARRDYENRAWADAFQGFLDARDELEADDVERLVWSAGLSGHDDEMTDALERLHQLRLDAGEPLRAARAGFWLALRLGLLGEPARAGGWLSRAQRIVERDGPDSVEAGYLRLPVAMRHLGSGDPAAAESLAAEAAQIADRFSDRGLGALARNIQGRAAVQLGHTATGLSLLDEVMVSAASGELPPIVMGIVYCSVIAGCQASYSFDRAREWTAALHTWCQSQPQLVPFAGTCLIHRSEILQLGGDWTQAFAEAQRASARLAGRHRSDSGGDAAYQEAEIHRLRGETALAEEAYARASELGRDPQPGFALLRLSQGRADAAASALRRALAATGNPLQRARLLPALVEILLAAAEVEEARRAAEELQTIASSMDVELLGAMALHALGAVHLAEEDTRGALDPLRRAQEAWQRVGAPYLSARIRVLLSRAALALGDEDGARLERDAARRTFVELGARPDLEALDAAARRPDSGGSHGLTARELQVLRLLASGRTNRAIATDLSLSLKTVDRHVSNIFGKIDVPSRAAATAYAYEHDLV